MKRHSLIHALVVSMGVTALGLGQSTAPAAHQLPNFGKVPLSFEINQGQTDRQVKFLAHGQGYTLFLTPGEAVLASRNAKPVRMKFVGSNPAPEIVGVNELAGKTNYFLGNAPKNWRANVPTYAKVRYKSIYSGIDLVYYGNQRQLEYDLIVAPGADPRRICFDVRGAGNIRKSETGELVFKMGDSEIRWHQPVVYQEKNGIRHEVAGTYAIKDRNHVAFEIAPYDRSTTLFIDPVLSYSTYLGGNGGDQGVGIAVDSSGNAYITGATWSTVFPLLNPLQPVRGGWNSAFIAKISPSGALVYSTYLGATSTDYAWTIGNGIAVDSAGAAYVTGSTSPNFPITPNAVQPIYGGGPNASLYLTNAFVSKLNPAGSALVYSTYLGGSAIDFGVGIAVDSSGAAYATGITDSTDFPIKNALQPALVGGQAAYVAKLNPSGSALVYSTFLGGSGSPWAGSIGVQYGDRGNGIAVDGAGAAYVTGLTYSRSFPTMNAFQPTLGGGDGNAFVTKLNPAGSAFDYSTYLGGSGGDWGYGIAVDSSGAAYVTGYTGSRNFPTSHAFQPALGGGQDEFVTKLDPSGTALVYSTYLGGSRTDLGFAIAVDSFGDAYVAGISSSTNFPTLNALQSALPGPFGDATVTKLNPSGSGLIYSTYLGGSGDPSDSYGDYANGIAVDSSGNAYVIGVTASTNFPTVNPIQSAFGGVQDVFVSKIAAAGTGTTLHLSNTEWTFGPSLAGTLSGSGVIYVTNTGATAANFPTYPLSASLPGLQYETTCGPMLAPYKTCEVQFNFTPQAVGPAQGTLTLYSDPNGQNVIQINGVGYGLHTSFPSWGFSPHPVGVTSGLGKIFLTNQTPTPMNLSSTVVRLAGLDPGDFALTDGCSAAVAPYTTCQLTFTFTPTAVGYRQAEIAITSPQIQYGSVIIPIAGDGE